jgi:hypothetical protein
MQANSALQNTNTGAAQFYADAQNNAIGNVYEVNEKLREVENLRATFRTSIESLQNAHSAILAQLRINDSIIGDTLDTIVIAALVTQNFYLMDNCKGLVSQIETALAAQQTNEEQKNHEAKILNDGLGAQEIFDINLAAINDIYLTSFANGKNNLSADQVVAITEIATQCPLIGGPAVYLARPMAEVAGIELEYNDAAVCLSQGVSMKHANELQIENKSSQVKIYPVPAKDAINFDLGYASFTKLTLYDCYGELL